MWLPELDFDVVVLSSFSELREDVLPTPRGSTGYTWQTTPLRRRRPGDEASISDLVESLSLQNFTPYLSVRLQ